MKITEIKSCVVGPIVSPEEFIAEHLFIFLIKGKMNGFDGNKHYTLTPGESCLVRKNHLARYNKQKDNNEFEKVVFILDEVFLKNYAAKQKIVNKESAPPSAAFLEITKSNRLVEFLQSLTPFYTDEGKITEPFADKKRKELLELLLQLHPEFAGILFDFGKPGKMGLEAFMHKNYKFNVSLERFAFLTGRSLSAYKRDFAQIFGQTPSRWLVQRRLQEAYYLLDQNNQKASDIYLELGFENLSHFSFAFKKQFGVTPNTIKTKKTSP